MEWMETIIILIGSEYINLWIYSDFCSDILGGYLYLVLFQLIIRLILRERERAGILVPSCVNSRLFVTVYNYIIFSSSSSSHSYYVRSYSVLLRQRKRKQKTCVIPGVGGVLPREGSAPGCAPGPPKLPLDEPFVAYSLDDLAAEA